MILDILITFGALFISDFCWTVCVYQVKEHEALKSSLWAVAFLFTGGLAIISYTSDHWMLIPAAFGAFAGTYVGVIWNKRKKE